MVSDHGKKRRDSILARVCRTGVKASSNPSGPARVVVDCDQITAIEPRGLGLTVEFTLPTPGATPPGTDRPVNGINTVPALGPTDRVPKREVTMRRRQEIL